MNLQNKSKKARGVLGSDDEDRLNLGGHVLDINLIMYGIKWGAKPKVLRLIKGFIGLLVKSTCCLSFISQSYPSVLSIV